MDYILSLTTNPLFIMAAFIAGLIIFHVVFIILTPLDAAQWKLIEYVWVTLALISVIGIFEEAKFFRAGQSITGIEMKVQKDFDRIDHWFNVYHDYACESDLDPEVIPDLCDWVQKRQEELALIQNTEPFPPPIRSNLTRHFDKIKDGAFNHEKDTIDEYIFVYSKTRDTYLKTLKNLERSAVSQLLIAFGPLLLIIAIALKFSKISGEYRLLRNKKKG